MNKKVLVLGLAIFGLGFTALVRANPPSDWLRTRVSEFATWQTAHPNAEQQLPDLKAKTAALIAAYKPAPLQAKYADISAQSAKLSAAQREAVRQYLAKAMQWYELGDISSAKEFFDLSLALDPANVKVNYLRADLYRRDAESTSNPYLADGYRANAALYFDRIVTLGPGTPEAEKARQALRELPHVTEEAEVNRPFVIWRVPNAPTEIWDASFAPKLVIVPAGEYTMGSLTTENKTELNGFDAENPRHRVRIAYPLAVGKYPVTRAEFAAFVADTGYDAKAGGCNLPNGYTNPHIDWENPGFPQTENDPVVCISYVNANAYVDWLTKKTGHSYRLLSESEWEYAARGGTATAYYWGNELGKGHANCPGCGSPWDDKSTSPVGSFPPNPFGLFDMAGNAWELIADCWNYSYAGAPVDGSAWREGNCANEMERGGDFNQRSAGSRSAERAGRGDAKELKLNIHTFRVARTL